MRVRLIRRLSRAAIEEELDGEALQAVLGALATVPLPVKSGTRITVSRTAAYWLIAADFAEEEAPLVEVEGAEAP